jgi:HAD superfamily hydrolase (TIGR01549 family)
MFLQHQSPAEAFSRRAMAAILLDLFNTLVRAPVASDISAFLGRRKISKKHPAYDLCCRGVLLAPLIAASGVDPKVAHQALMTSRVRDVADCVELIEKLGKIKIDNESRDLACAFRDFFYTACQLDEEGVREVRTLIADEHKLVVVTNADAVSLEVISLLAINTWVDATVASCDIGYMKPDVEIFARAAESAKSSPAACIMIGDSWRADIVGALNFGARAVWLDLNCDPVARFIQTNGPAVVSALARPEARSEWESFLSLSLPAGEWRSRSGSKVCAPIVRLHWDEAVKRGASLVEVARIARNMIADPLPEGGSRGAS